MDGCSCPSIRVMASHVCVPIIWGTLYYVHNIAVKVEHFVNVCGMWTEIQSQIHFVKSCNDLMIHVIVIMSSELQYM